VVTGELTTSVKTTARCRFSAADHTHQRFRGGDGNGNNFGLSENFGKIFFLSFGKFSSKNVKDGAEKLPFWKSRAKLKL